MSSQDKAEQFVFQLARHERALAAYVMTLVPQAADAEDVLQQAKLVMWRSFDQFTPGTNFGAWARRVAFHQILNHRKRQKRDRLWFSDEFLEAVAQEVEQSAGQLEAQHRALNDCLARLPVDQRDLLHLRYHQGQTIEVIATRLNRTVAAVYRALSRVRRTLHECVTRTIRNQTRYEPEGI